MKWLQLHTPYALLLAFATTLGCSQGDQNDAAVQGNVTIDGVLASRGTVTFFPAKGGPVAVGQIHPDGSYSLRTGLNAGGSPDDAKIRPGQYVVTVMVTGEPAAAELHKADGSPPIAGPRLTSIKYASKETSGLHFDIKPGLNMVALELEGAAHDPPPESAGDAGIDGDAEAATENLQEADSDTADQPPTESPAASPTESSPEISSPAESQPASEGKE